MRRVLVVDDERELLDIMGFALEIEGLQVEKAHTYEDAYRALAERKFDFLITDFRLPGGRNGVDLIRHARTAIEQPPRAVLVTGLTEAVDHGGLAEGIFYKPFDLEKLTTWVRSHTDRAELGLFGR